MDNYDTLPGWQEALLRLVQRARRYIKPVQPTAAAGMGAIPTADGTAFRVWAPHAQEVSVAGSFNRWSRARHPLASEGNGYWSADVSPARLGDEYKIAIRNNGTVQLRTDPYAREVTPPLNNGVVRAAYPPQQQQAPPPWMPRWNEMVIYELHVGTFAESADGPPGDFQGVIDKLSYLRRLGVNAIEIMPIAEFAGDFSWGYNPAHPFAITQVYGGPDAFRKLVQAAHDHGIAVIVDVVYNHFGPQDLSLWQFDGWQQDSKGGVFFYNDWRSTTPWADTRPDYGRAEVRQYIRDNALMWLEEFGVDGLRWDATAWIRNVYGNDSDPGNDIAEGWALMQWINNEIDGRYPWKISIAEDLRGNAWITKETAAGGAGFDAQWDERFVHPTRQAVIVADDAERDLAAVADALTARYNGDVFERVIYTESHDEVANGKARVPEEIAPGAAASLFAKRRAALGAALVFTAPGIPMLFQGQEFLEDGWFDDHDALDWQKAKTHAGIVALYRDLIRLRRNLDGATRGLTGQHVNVHYRDDDAKLLAFHRWMEGGPNDDVVIVVNFANRSHKAHPVPFPVRGRWRLRFNSDSRAYDTAFSDVGCSEVIASVAEDEARLPTAEIAIGPYAALIYSQAEGDTAVKPPAKRKKPQRRKR